MLQHAETEHTVKRLFREREVEQIRLHHGRTIPDGLAAGVDGRARVDGDDVRARRHKHFGKATRTASDLEHPFAGQILRPAGALEEARTRDRLSCDGVELDPAVAVPLLAEAVRVAHVGHRLKPMLYPCPS